MLKPATQARLASLLLPAWLILIFVAHRPPVPVTYVQPTHTIFPVVVGSAGVIAAAEEATIAYPFQSQVVDILVEVGQTVTKGQIVLDVDTAPLQAQLDQAVAMVQSATSYLTQVQALEAPSPVVVDAQGRLAIAQSRYYEIASLVQSPAVHAGRVIATKDGVVRAIKVVIGSPVRPNAPLIIIDDLTHLIATTQLPLQEISGLQLGDTAEIIPAATPHERAQGLVTAMLPSLRKASTNTVDLRITLLPTHSPLLINQSVYVRLTLYRALLTLPAATLHEASGTAFVFVVHAGQAQRRYIGLLAKHELHIGIAWGVQRSDQIIGWSAQPVHPGDLIREQEDV